MQVAAETTMNALRFFGLPVPEAGEKKNFLVTGAPGSGSGIKTMENRVFGWRRNCPSLCQRFFNLAMDLVKTVDLGV